MSEDRKKQSNFGNYLNSIRKTRGLTLINLQDTSGVSNSYLSQIENNKFKPSVDVLLKLSKPLDIPLIELMYQAGHIPIEVYNDHWNVNAKVFELESQIRKLNKNKEYNHLISLEHFKILNYPDIKTLLNNDVIYYDKKTLNNADKSMTINVLDALFKDLKVNYPSNEEIEKEYKETIEYAEGDSTKQNNKDI